ncbi:hypothetical protein [Candidatus Allofournierella excrementavium]|uniref:hypothetical protein n=1 Tax=Candidatus Allofournierella excrementavium TaxID=2838591 RepID=UPI003AF72701
MKKRLAASVLALGLAAAAAVWVGRAPRFAHASPDYPMVDLTGVVERAEEGKADYRLLFAQTGLGAPAVDALLEEGRGGELEDFQARYFAPCAWKTVKGAAVVRLEVTEKDFEFAPLEKGDILLTPSSRCGGWRNGHAALVVDAQEGLVLEAYSLGCPSQLSSLSTWQDKAAVAVLRLKGVSEERRARMADWARENLVGLPYGLFSGLAWLGESTGPPATQCAHLVWCACAAFGWDIDGYGGWPVTPRDISLSPLLETVQVWGLPQGQRWPS